MVFSLSEPLSGKQALYEAVMWKTSPRRVKICRNVM